MQIWSTPSTPRVHVGPDGVPSIPKEVNGSVYDCFKLMVRSLACGLRRTGSCEFETISQFLLTLVSNVK